MSRIFIDTDVILDLFLDREPHHSTALHLFTVIKIRNIPCFISPIGIANASYILSKTRTLRYAMGKIRGLRKLLRVAPVDEKMIDAALADPFRDFEDSIQRHCAASRSIGLIITRNVSHYPKGEPTAMVPDEFLKMLSAKGP